MLEATLFMFNIQYPKDNLDELRHIVYAQQSGEMNQRLVFNITPDIFAENIYQLYADQVDESFEDHFIKLVIIISLQPIIKDMKMQAQIQEKPHIQRIYHRYPFKIAMT